MTQIVICDDNKAFADLFRRTAEKQFAAVSDDTFQCRISGVFNNGSDLIAFAGEHRIDVLFLDIDMPETSGFEIAKVFSEDHSETLIVFVSGYDNFVYESFDYFPFAYLRKEKIADELPKTVKRIKEKLSEQTKYIILATPNAEIKTDVKEILYFESRKNYYVAHLTDGREYSCRGTMAKLENDTRELGFFRVHSAFIVNLEHIERITNDGYVQTGGDEIPVAKKRTREFRKAFLEHTRRRIGL